MRMFSESESETHEVKVSGETTVGSSAAEEPVAGPKPWQLRKQGIRSHTEAYDILITLKKI